MTIATALVTPDHHDGLLQLFEEASAGCHCRWWHFSGDDYAWQQRCGKDASENLAEMRAALTGASPEAQGVVAIEDPRVVGWLKLCPAPKMAKLLGRRVYRTLDCFDGPREDVVVIGCMLVHPSMRKRGVARALVSGAIDVATSLGARTIEAMPRCASHAMRDDEVWMGPHNMLIDQGFTKVAGPDPYPVLRRQL